tara:strand:- start:8275 stop:8592 length:318 start_codon:yes stop_codon:yes gene_type:complete
MAEKQYKVVNGEYIELTAEEIQELEDRRAAADLDFTMVRGQRDALLRETDWTRLDDATLGDHTAEEWATYRQELRDLPGKHSKVSEVVFPDDPPTKKAKEDAEKS